MRLSTGIQLLDRRLDGGFPRGSLVAFVAPPETQSELLLSRLASERSTYFVSTTRPADEVQVTIGHDAGAPFTATRVRPDALLEAPARVVGGVDPESNLFVDPVDVLETEDRRAYLDFLDVLKQRVNETDGLGFLCGLESASTPDLRTMTLKRADVVFQLRVTVNDSEIATTLLVPKFRGGRAVREPIKLLLTDRVRIDTSRDIA